MEKTSKTPFSFFCEISAIPRASGNEAGIARYLAAFAAEHGLFCVRDEHHTVLIRKSGSPGRENEPALLLEAHTDMVAEQNSGTDHDFAHEGISLVREGNILHADGTTLGADDGFGVAIMLAVLADSALSHPPLECLFTVSEETGMLGALAFDYSHLSARRMVNLDSAGEREVITGCCGGVRHDLSLPVSFKAAPDGAFYTLSISGLSGGHSGEDIHKGRLNAHVLMRQLLSALDKKSPLRLAFLGGGDKDNAIPRECVARFAVQNGEAVRAHFPELQALAGSLVSVSEDAGLALTLTESTPEPVMSLADTKRVLAVLSLPNGVLEWNEKSPSLPEVSRNLARIRTEAGAVTFGFSSRSPSAKKLDVLRAALDTFSGRLGGQVRHFAAYPGWENPENARIVERWQEAYRRVTGAECVPTVIHAGLECGVISAALPGLEAVSVGCNIYDLHTPRERMELDSFERIYRTLCEFLRIC